MTHLEKLEAVRQEIIRAVPEITKLEFGCRVLWKGEKWNIAKLTDDSILIVHPDGVRVANISCEKYGYSREVKNIGREIQLHDVLRAIQKRASIVGWLKIVAAFEQYTDLKGGTPDIYYFLIENWDLSKTYEEQDEPTINFLHEIFYPKQV